MWSVECALLDCEIDIRLGAGGIHGWEGEEMSRIISVAGRDGWMIWPEWIERAISAPCSQTKRKDVFKNDHGITTDTASYLQRTQRALRQDEHQTQVKKACAFHSKLVDRTILFQSTRHMHDHKL